MTTRTRGRRSNKPVPESPEAPQPRTGTRTTRRDGALRDADNRTGYGSLSRDPVPRRSAPMQSSGASVASLGSRVRSQSEVDDDEEEDEEDEEQAHGSFSADEEVRWQVMYSLLPDFTGATDGLKQRLENGSYDNKVFAMILDAKRKAFHALLEHYEEDEPSESPFIGTEWLERLRARGENDTRIPNALVRANIVNALDGIEQLSDATIKDPVPFLEDLDSCFSHLFAPPEAWKNHWELALDLRTCYLIEVLSAQRGQYDVKEAIASVFCKATGGADYAKLFTNGPFKGLTDRNETETTKEEDELISARTEMLYTFSRADKKDHGLGRMRKEFPLDKTLKDLKQCFLELYSASKYAERGDTTGLNGQTETGRESWHDAEETIPDSISESQPIIRPTAADVKRSTLFKGAESLKVFQSSTTGHIQIPPSNQQQHNKAPSIAPTDYSEDDTRNLLSQDIIRTPGQGNKRKRTSHPTKHHHNNDEDDDDDEDAFEDDTRHIPSSRLAQVKAHSAAQAAKRQRLPTNPPSREMPPPPIPASSPSQPNYEAIKHRKSEILAAARSRALNSSQLPPSSSTTITTHAISPPHKQRHVWTDHDSTLLIRLVGEKHAAWSHIEKEHRGEFEHPRNQQAYRDKARNMKVDFLLLDTTLPPGFDLVALGKKEVERLLSLGKNPYRKESEIDEDGNAINTDLSV